MHNQAPCNFFPHHTFKPRYLNQNAMNSYKSDEDLIKLAIAHHLAHPDLKLAQVARLFGCNYGKFRRRVNGLPSKSTRPKTNQPMNPAQLKALELYIMRLDSLGQPPLIRIWRAAAEAIRKETSPPGAVIKPLGRDFFKRYQKANPHIKKIKQKPTEPARVAAQDYHIIKSYFKELKDVIEKYGIHPDDI